MVDQPKRGDDDEAAPPEVTVPPWLRTGPTPDVPVSPPSPVEESAARPGEAAGERAGTDRQELSRGAAPNRIRLGAGRRSDSHGDSPSGDADGPGDTSGDDPAGRPPRPQHNAAEDGRRTSDLSSLTLRTGQSGSMHPPGAGAARDARDDGAVLDASNGGESRDPRGAPGSRARRIALAAAAGVAVLGGSAVLGFVITRGVVAPVDEQTAGCASVSEPGRVAGDGPGSLDSPLETVLAFDHAYYVERSAEKAFEAVSPSSRITEEQLRADGVERVPEGTAHCVDARELSPTLLEVTLTESPPDVEPVVIRQRVRVAENPDGSWGIVSITPAG